MRFRPQPPWKLRLIQSLQIMIVSCLEEIFVRFVLTCINESKIEELAAIFELPSELLQGLFLLVLVELVAMIRACDFGQLSEGIR